MLVQDSGLGRVLAVAVLALNPEAIVIAPPLVRRKHHLFGFRVLGFRFRVPGFGFQVSDSGFRVSGFGFQVQGPLMRLRGKLPLHLAPHATLVLVLLLYCMMEYDRFIIGQLDSRN